MATGENAMRGFNEAVSILSRTSRMTREFRDTCKNSPRDDDVVRRIDSKFEEAAAAVHEDRMRLNSLISELKHDISLGEQMITELSDVQGYEEEIEVFRRELQKMKETEEYLEREARGIKNELDEYEKIISEVDAKKESLSGLEQAHQKNHNELALYAQITRVIPDLGSQTVRGTIIDKQRRLKREIELDAEQMSEFELCRTLWQIGA